MTFLSLQILTAAFLILLGLLPHAVLRLKGVRLPYSVSVVLGFSLASAIGWKIYVFNGPAVGHWAKFFILGYIGLGLVSIFLAAKTFGYQSVMPSRTTRALFFIALAALTLPHILMNSGPGPITHVGFDFFSYSTLSDVLTRFRMDDPLMGLWLEREGSIRSLISQNVFGIFFLLGTEASLLDSPTFLIVQPLGNVAFALSAVLVFHLCQSVFRLSNLVSVLGTLAFILNPLLTFVPTEAFLGQIFCVTLFNALIYLWFHRNRLSTTHFFILLTLLSWGALSFYPHFLPFVFLPVFALGLLEKRFADAALLGLALLTALLYSPAKVTEAIKYSNVLLNIGGGASYPSINFDRLMGWDFHPTMEARSESLKVLADAVFLFILYKSVRHFWKTNNRSPAYLTIIVYLTYLASNLAMKLLGVEMRGYKLFKVICLYLPILIVAIWAAFDRVRWVKTICIITLLLSAFQLSRYWNIIFESGHTLTSKDIQFFQDVRAQKPSGLSFLVPTKDIWDTNWASYFWGDLKLDFWSTHLSGTKGEISEPYAVVLTTPTLLGIKEMPSGKAWLPSDVVAASDTHQLVKLVSTGDITKSCQVNHFRGTLKDPSAVCPGGQPINTDPFECFCSGVCYGRNIPEKPELTVGSENLAFEKMLWQCLEL